MPLACCTSHCKCKGSHNKKNKKKKMIPLAFAMQHCKMPRASVRKQTQRNGGCPLHFPHPIAKCEGHPTKIIENLRMPLCFADNIAKCQGHAPKSYAKLRDALGILQWGVDKAN